MNDAVFLVLIVLLFGATMGLVLLLEKLMEPSK